MAFKRHLGSVLFLLCIFGTSAVTASGNNGKEFVFTPMPNYLYTDEELSLGVVIQNGNVQSEVRISVPGRDIEFNVTLPPNSSPYNYQLSSLANNFIHPSTSGPITDSTITVSSDVDISILVYNTAQRTSDLYTALPKKYFGKEHFVALMAVEGTPQWASGIISISSLNQRTSIEIHLKSTVQFENTIFYSGDIINYTLSTYQSIQLLPRYINITGTRILSNASIAVSAGSKCSYVPQDFTACDHLAEQLAPFKAWGKQFVMSPFAGRRSGYLLQIIAGRENTTVIFNNSAIELNMGDYHTIDIPTQMMHFVSADKPISIMQYAKGNQTDSKDDPSMIRAIPNEQFVSEATFPVYRFSSNSTTIDVMYLGVTANCRYVNDLSISKDGVQFSPNWIEEYSIETHNGTIMCTRWSEVGHGSYFLRSQQVILPDGQVVYPRFRAVVYGSGKVRESYLYRAASNDRPLTCKRTSGSSPVTQEFDCPEYCSPARIGNMSFSQGEVGVSMDSTKTCPLDTTLGGQPIGRAVCVDTVFLGPLWQVTQQTKCGPPVTDRPEYCSPTRIGNMSFPQGEVGVYMDSTETCPLDTTLAGQPLGRAVCVNNVLLEPVWQVTQQTECGPIRSGEQILHEILEGKITNDTAEKVIEQTAAVTSSPDGLTQTDVANIALIIKNITNLQIGDPEITSLMTAVVSNAADVNEEDLYELETNKGAVTEILEAFEEQLKYVVVPEGETYTTSTSNVAVQVTDVAPSKFSSGLNLTAEHFNLTTDPSMSNDAFHQDDGSFPDSHLPFQVAIPPGVFDGQANKSTPGGNGIRVALAVFRTSSLFGSRFLREVNENETDFNRSSNSLIVGLTIGGEEMTKLKENIVFTFAPLMGGYQDPVCSFWNTSIPDWSSTGCQKITSKNDVSDKQTYDITQTITCSCDHLTNFAVLMDIHASGNPPVPVLRTLSFIGCSISILSLAITLVTYLSNKKLHAHQSQKIFLCLCGTLLCLYVTFIIMSALDTYPGMHQIPEVKAGPCGFLAALIHFFTISSLAWMGVEAFNTYLIVVRVFNSYIPHFMIKAGLVAWGASGVIVALTGAVARENYASPDYCFLQFWPLIGGLLIPIALILFFNIAVFILVVRQLARSVNMNIKTDDAAERRKNTIERVKNAVGILILLGLTWITGYFILIETNTIVAQVLFIILNSLQGLFILILYCLRNPMVRSYWGKMIPRAFRRGSEGVRTVSYQTKSERNASTSGRTLSTSSSVDNPTFVSEDPSTAITFTGKISKDLIPY